MASPSALIVLRVIGAQASAQTGFVQRVHFSEKLKLTYLVNFDAAKTVLPKPLYGSPPPSPSFLPSNSFFVGLKLRIGVRGVADRVYDLQVDLLSVWDARHLTLTIGQTDQTINGVGLQV
ncbi:hypothetical protein D3C72_1201470 [compost metagenome]